MVGSTIYNFRSDKSPEAQEFITGTSPNPSLDGMYKGNEFKGMGASWMGKQFNSAQNTGINNFRGKDTAVEQRYEFSTSVKNGLRNKDKTVLLLDYNVIGNPIWLRFIRDEIVQVSPNHYLGKIHVKIGPIVTTIGYFRLDK